MKLLTLVVPIYNEQETVRPFVERIEEVWPQIASAMGKGATLEILFVNDGSSDLSRDVIANLKSDVARLRLVNLSRNFGKEAALSAGLHHACGDIVVPIDVDLQDPPEVIAEMVERWKSGAKVVNGRRTDRSHDGWFKRKSASAFYSLFERLADHPVHRDVGDFRLMDRDAVHVINQLSEQSRFNKGLFSWIGFEVDTVEYKRPERFAGETKWKLRKLWSLAIDGITSTTTLPLRVWTYLGAVIAFGAFIYAAFLIGYTIVEGRDVPGYASIMVAVLLLGGLNLLSLGLIGEYLGRVAVQVRGRPLYVVESIEEIDAGA
ncbi:glycosyltransferase family 2 protein [Sphingomicrobium flavum]|uniref:glycosyltransferase family 2 protein n=1 Tax=Sphingomicrobium flavum TaxID=1229164 RepID=UPI0021ADE2E9|nr:glycosyltransferase family 2 protein [Sphingomicrobium flavum]